MYRVDLGGIEGAIRACVADTMPPMSSRATLGPEPTAAGG